MFLAAVGTFCAEVFAKRKHFRMWRCGRDIDEGLQRLSRSCGVVYDELRRKLPGRHVRGGTRAGQLHGVREHANVSMRTPAAKSKTRALKLFDVRILHLAWKGSEASVAVFSKASHASCAPYMVFR